MRLLETKKPVLARGCGLGSCARSLAVASSKETPRSILSSTKRSSRCGGWRSRHSRRKSASGGAAAAASDAAALVVASAAAAAAAEEEAAGTTAPNADSDSGTRVPVSVEPPESNVPARGC